MAARDKILFLQNIAQKMEALKGRPRAEKNAEIQKLIDTHNAAWPDDTASMQDAWTSWVAWTQDPVQHAQFAESQIQGAEAGLDPQVIAEGFEANAGNHPPPTFTAGYTGSGEAPQTVGGVPSQNIANMLNEVGSGSVLDKNEQPITWEGSITPEQVASLGLDTPEAFFQPDDWLDKYGSDASDLSVIEHAFKDQKFRTGAFVIAAIATAGILLSPSEVTAAANTAETAGATATADVAAGATAETAAATAAETAATTIPGGAAATIPAAAPVIGGEVVFAGMTMQELLAAGLTAAEITGLLGSDPSTTDPAQFADAAEAQAAAQAQLQSDALFGNRINQVTPEGEINFDVQSVIDPTTGQPRNQWTQTTTLSPEQQSLFEGAQQNQASQQQLEGGLTANAKGALADPVDFSGASPLGDVAGTRPIAGTDFEFGGVPQAQRVGEGLPDFGTIPGAGTYDPGQVQSELDYSNLPGISDPTALRSRIEDSIYNTATSRLDPRFAQRQSDLELKLRGQGLRPGTPAYDRAMGNLGRERTDAYQTALDASVMGGGVETQRQFGQELDRRIQGAGELERGGDFYNRAGSEEFNQRLLGGGQRYNELFGGASMSDAQRAQMMSEQLGASGLNFGQDLSIGTFQDRQREADLLQQRQLGSYGYDQDRQFGADQTALRQQMIAELLSGRNQALTELGSARTGAIPGTISTPSFALGQAGQAPDYLSAARSASTADINNQNAELARREALWGGATDLIGMFS